MYKNAFFQKYITYPYELTLKSNCELEIGNVCHSRKINMYKYVKAILFSNWNAETTDSISLSCPQMYRPLC